jgi:hypothetical protein
MWGSGECSSYYTRRSLRNSPPRRKALCGHRRVVLTDEKVGLLTVRLVSTVPGRGAGMLPGEKWYRSTARTSRVDLEEVVDWSSRRGRHSVSIGFTRMGEYFEKENGPRPVWPTGQNGRWRSNKIAYMPPNRFHRHCSGCSISTEPGPGPGRQASYWFGATIRAAVKICGRTSRTCCPAAHLLSGGRVGRQVIDMSDALPEQALVVWSTDTAPAPQSCWPAASRLTGGVIIGETNFGKGGAQSFPRVRVGSVLRRPGTVSDRGRTRVQDVGVIPTSRLIRRGLQPLEYAAASDISVHEGVEEPTLIQ